MPFKNWLRITFLITWKKIVTSKINFFIFIGFLILLFFIWQKNSYELSFKFFLFFFPYLFLFLSQGMVRNEIDNGCLENVIFLKENFKNYLLKKNVFLGSIGILSSLIIFSFFALYAIATHQFSDLYIYQFLIGIIVGFYYVSLGILLSYYFKGGSNVLIMIISQFLIFFGFLFTVLRSSGFIDYLDKGAFPDFLSKIKFLGLIVLFPNLVILKKFFIYSIAIIVLCVFLYILQGIKIRDLELIRK